VAAEEAAAAAEAEAAAAAVQIHLTTEVFSKGDFGELNVGKDKFNELARKTGVLRRVCNDCHADYQNIVYVRLVGIETFDYYDNMLITWSDKDNKLGTDFQLYSSMDDAIAGANPWKYCNYNDYGWQIGFPRDCGPNGGRGWQWTSFKHTGTKKDYIYYVEPSIPCVDSVSSVSGRSIELVDLPAVGGKVFTDRGYKFSDVAAGSYDPQCKFVLGPNDDKNTPAANVQWTLNVCSPVTVYLDFWNKEPAQDTLGFAQWKEGWTLSDKPGTIFDSWGPGKVYKKDFPAGKVDLYGNDGGGVGTYYAFVCPK